MPTVYKDGQYTTLTKEDYAEQYPQPEPELPAQVPADGAAAVRTLAQGLPQATTIAQIRAAAQQFLDETEGTA